MPRREVSIHAPTRGATVSRQNVAVPIPVSIHAPTRGATLPRSSSLFLIRRFNSRAHEGRDACTMSPCATMMFQFTRPRGARRYRATIGDEPVEFQFTRPRGARPRPGRARAKRRPVSIHAPTRGATLNFSVGPGLSLFQFTRPRGARRLSTCTHHTLARFNSRAHEGRDALRHSWPHRPFLFQFTRPRGARLRMAFQLQRMLEFQFTRPRGARLTSALEKANEASFNSRAHEGRDLKVRTVPEKSMVSIHAPTRGATPHGVPVATHAGVSIHAPTRGATGTEHRTIAYRGFNSRAHEGRDKGPEFFFSRIHVSIHAPTRGATKPNRNCFSFYCFNSRAHEGRDQHALQLERHAERFNSRAHEGRDPLRVDWRENSGSFNSRAHEGRDERDHNRHTHQQVSIHAPTRGATW